jgi:hypothetical protein
MKSLLLFLMDRRSFHSLSSAYLGFPSLGRRGLRGGGRDSFPNYSPSPNPLPSRERAFQRENPPRHSDLDYKYGREVGLLIQERIASITAS